MRLEFEKRKNYMVERIKNIDKISMLEPKGAFYVFIDISKLLGKTIDGVEIKGAREFGQVLLDKAKVAIIPCTDFGFDDHIRLSYAISLENIKEGLDRIEKFIKEYY